MNTKRKTSYGKKGGEGVNKGRKVTVYTAIAPDGSMHQKRSYKSIQKPVMGFYEHNGIWYPACVTDAKDAFAHYENKEATPA